jgi:hypothetical protein
MLSPHGGCSHACCLASQLSLQSFVSSGKVVLGLRRRDRGPRARILQDTIFIEGYTNDNWRGKKLDVGKDTSISRWLQSHGWTIAIQALPETEVRRKAKTLSDFLKQMFR